MAKRYKYPKTSHLPWSESFHKTDHRMIDPVSVFGGMEVVVTVKFDGENTTWYKDGFHSRSIDSGYHESRAFVNRLHGEKSWMLNDNERICGENLYAEHSIHYKDLNGYFYVFGYWIDNECQSWDDTVKRAEELDLPTVDVIYRGIWDEIAIKALKSQNFNGNEMEGYVVRPAGAFTHDFESKTAKMPLAKYVRKDHVQTDQHWTKKKVIPNELRKYE